MFWDVPYTFINQTVFRKLLFLYMYEIFWKVIVSVFIFLLSLDYFVSTIYFLFYNLFPERDYTYVDMLLDFILPKRLIFETKWMGGGLYTLQLECLYLLIRILSWMSEENIKISIDFAAKKIFITLIYSTLVLMF